MRVKRCCEPLEGIWIVFPQYFNWWWSFFRWNDPQVFVIIFAVIWNTGDIDIIKFTTNNVLLVSLVLLAYDQPKADTQRQDMVFLCIQNMDPQAVVKVYISVFLIFMQYWPIFKIHGIICVLYLIIIVNCKVWRFTYCLGLRPPCYNVVYQTCTWS